MLAKLIQLCQSLESKSSLKVDTNLTSVVKGVERYKQTIHDPWPQPPTVYLARLFMQQLAKHSTTCSDTDPLHMNTNNKSLFWAQV